MVPYRLHIKYNTKEKTENTVKKKNYKRGHALMGGQDI